MPYPAELKSRVLEASKDRLSLREAAVLHTDLGLFFAAVAARHLPAEECALIGSHGQTVCHLPDFHTTLQLGDGAIIANQTGVATVSDFRTADMALGGQGAPLVPLFDAFLLQDPDLTRVAVNLGGIANITLIPPGGVGVRAWDTGPANCLSDALCRTYSNHDFDPGGGLAAEGKVLDEVLATLLRHPYFHASPPKSTGLEDFGQEFADHSFPEGSLPDLLRTALALSAQTLVDDICRAVQDIGVSRFEVVLAGGGTANQTLMQEISQRLSGAAELRGWETPGLRPFSDFGVPEDAREAVAFAYLADLTARGLPGTSPATTGATRPAVLGKVSFS